MDCSVAENHAQKDFHAEGNMDSQLLQEIERYLQENFLDIVALSEMGVKFSYGTQHTGRIGQMREKLEKIFAHFEDSFSQRLMKLIRKKGKSEVEVYKKAQLDRRLFSKIRTDVRYTPSKRNIMALVISLELNMKEAEDLLRRAGYALSSTRKEDVILRYFIEQGEYDLFLINDVLDYYGLPILGDSAAH